MKQFRTLRKDEIDVRIGTMKKDGSGLTLLLYKDARCDQSILDETVGPMNWQRHHSRDNANCIVSIWDEDKRMWVEKEDTGTESRTEKEKGLASDSFKRACFNWGIGRELYTAPFIWINKGDYSVSGDGKCYDNFTVDTIEYQPDGQREIRSLIIRNEKTGKICFRWQTGERKAAPDIEQEQVTITERHPATATVKTLRTLMNNAMLAYGKDNAPARFEVLLRKAGCTRDTMNEHFYDLINGWILDDIRKNSKGAA